jgi:hypothetical protein
MSLYLPASVQREIADRRDSYRAAVLDSIDTECQEPLLLEYCARLQSLDRRLLLVRARETVIAGVPMKPGYYHLLIDNGPGIPVTVTVIEGAGGEFCEPTSRIFEKLGAGDMREQRNLDRFERTERDRFESVEREKARDRDERREHIGELVKAYTETSVSLTDARPWTQNQSANSMRDAGERK